MFEIDSNLIDPFAMYLLSINYLLDKSLPAKYIFTVIQKSSCYSSVFKTDNVIFDRYISRKYTLADQINSDEKCGTV